MKILISNKVSQPIYEQIKIQIKEQIMSGILKENDALPSIRQLAKELSISVITTTRAYSDLESEGFISTRQGIGTFVLGRDSELIKEQYLKVIESNFLSAIDYANSINLSKEDLVNILLNLMEEK